MLRIRAEQNEVFKQAAVRRFEGEMIVHLRQFAPKHFKILEEGDIRKVVRSALERAPQYGLTSERSIRYYVEVMLMLGSGFDSDPQMPWSAEILNDESVAEQAARIDSLYDKAWDYADHVILDYQDSEGAVDPSRFVDLIRQIRHEAEEVLSPSNVPGFYQRVIQHLRQRFPNKCSYVGELCLRRLIQRAIEAAEGYGITTERGVVLFIAMMFVLGSGFHQDPQLPWASTILTDPSITDQNERVNRLYAAAVDCLKRWWG